MTVQEDQHGPVCSTGTHRTDPFRQRVNIDTVTTIVPSRIPPDGPVAAPSVGRVDTAAVDRCPPSTGTKTSSTVDNRCEITCPTVGGVRFLSGPLSDRVELRGSVASGPPARHRLPLWRPPVICRAVVSLFPTECARTTRPVVARGSTTTRIVVARLWPGRGPFVARSSAVRRPTLQYTPTNVDETH